MKLLICSVISLALLSSAVDYMDSQTTNTHWLAGTWENKSPRGSMYETWKVVSKNELAGKSYMLKGKDTVVFENIRLIRKNNILTYIPTVNGQNNNQPVNFPLIKSSEDKLVFENKAHDFPQTISYTRISKDSLVAEIAGISKGLAKRQAYPMKRIK
ncbi:MAG: DUF6265 family protein [Bacteroidota bacterium]